VTERNDEFYVGYLSHGPPGIARRTRSAVAVALACGLAAAGLLAMAQADFDRGWFEFGIDREWTGVVLERPYPRLRVTEEGQASARSLPTSFHLVAFGKYGAEELVAGLDGEPVRIRGSLIHNEQERMLEVHEVEPWSGAEAERLRAAGRPEERQLGRVTLVGEIVDSKCHLGVMKPGRGKTHKACAIRCISGGIPPLLRVEDNAGEVEYFLLVAADGRSVNREVLDLVAEPVEISGEVVRSGDLLVLYADPHTYRRVGSD